MSQFCARSRRGLRLERADSMAMFIAAGPLGAAAVVAMVACWFGKKLQVALESEVGNATVEYAGKLVASQCCNVYVRTAA